jgi:tetratricopeptide (TPR) repeat protein
MTSKVIVAIILTFVFALLAAAGADPQEAARLNNIGVAYMNQQLFQKGLKFFEEAAAKDPNLKVTALNRGVALLNLQRGDEAKALLEKAAKEDPNDAHSFYSLGLYYKNSSHPEAAVANFRHVTEIDPSDADTWYFLGSTYAQLKQFPEAIDAFEHALKIDPLHASAQFGLARAYQQSGQANTAHQAMKKFQYITQNKLGAPISLIYGEQGKYSRAEESPVVVEKVGAAIPVKFVDVRQRVGLSSKVLTAAGNDPALGPGGCFLDYDNDGQIDVLLTNNGTEGGLALFHNVGGKFDDVTRKAGLDPAMHAIGCTTGDYDNDGAVDIALVSSSGWVVLLHNEKNGQFKDVTHIAGFPTPETHEPSRVGRLGAVGVTFVDYDHDGDLDLYVTQVTPTDCDAEHIKGGDIKQSDSPRPDLCQRPGNEMWRNNGNGTFTDVTEQRALSAPASSASAVGTDYNNDRAVDIVATGWHGPPAIFENPREGKFLTRQPWSAPSWNRTAGVAVIDFNHDSWMDLAFTHWGAPGISLWKNKAGKTFAQVPLPKVDWVRAFGVAAFDYDNDGWVDLAAVGETKDGRGEVRLFRNLGPDGWKDVTADVGLDKIQLKEPRAIIAGDYDNDGAVDLLITQNHGPAVLLHNEGGSKNNSLRLALKGLNDNKSAIGTKVEVFSAGLRQKFEVYGSSGYLGQNSPYLTIGLGQAKEADVVRMVWPTGVLEDEIEIAANKRQEFLEIDRRGSSCPTLFAWDGTHYALVGDMLGAGVVGHWVGQNGPNVIRNIARPTEYIKLDRNMLREKFDSRASQNRGNLHPSEPKPGLPGTPDVRRPILSFRFMEPLEESVYLDQVELLAVDHPANVEVYPNEYFASNPPYPQFKVVFSRDARPPAGAWDEHGHNVLPDLLAHRYFGDFKVLSFPGFTEPHSLELDLGEPYRGGPLWLLMHGEIEYFTATSMYAADQAHLQPFAPYLEALVEPSKSARASLGRARLQPCPKAAPSYGASALGGRAADGNDTNCKWVRVIDDLGFPAGGARTMTADLTGKLPLGTQRIRFTTNLQIYWDTILVSRTIQHQSVRLTSLPLARADLSFHGFPLKIEGQPPGNVKYIYEKASATGPYTRPAGAYTRYGDVRPLLAATDDKFAVFGSGDVVALDFDPANLPSLPQGWVRDYFFAAHGYEKDMDFYSYRGDTVEPLPYRDMETYPYPGKSFPADPDHVNYQLEYNTRFMSGNEASGYSFHYSK